MSTESQAPRLKDSASVTARLNSLRKKSLFFRRLELELRRKVLARNGLQPPEESFFLVLLHFSAACEAAP
jgi:hypothetical protein